MWNRWFRGIFIRKPMQFLYILVAVYYSVFMVQIENFEVWIKGVKTSQKGVKSLIGGRGTILDKSSRQRKKITITAVWRSTVMSILWCPHGNLRSFLLILLKWGVFKAYLRVLLKKIKIAYFFTISQFLCVKQGPKFAKL